MDNEATTEKKMAHRIKFTSKYGADQTVRVFGCDDRDMAAMKLNAAIPGVTIKSAEFVEDGAARVWGEQDLES